MAQIKVHDKSIHDERRKGFNEVFTAAQFLRILDNITPSCMLFKWSDDSCIFSKLANIFNSKLNQVKLHNDIKAYPFKPVESLLILYMNNWSY